jgi:LacI family transcriptional regulator
MTRRTTMSDVAREAGVSLMTVSRVLNEKGEVSAETRQRVLAVMARLDYRPSGVARSLATQRTSTIGLVVPDNANPFFSEVARGVEHAAYAHGYNVFLCNTDEDLDRERAVLHSLEEKRVDGLVLCSSRLEDDELRSMIARHPAMVLVNRRLEGEGVSAVLVDDELGGRLATEHLLRTGRRRIGFLTGPTASRSGRQRVNGYLAAFAAAGVPYGSAWVRPCAPTVEGGRQASRELLAAHPGLTALLCYNDLVAVGALQACAELHCAVPGQLAIVGFDDIPLAALVTPPLTTCRAPRYELGCEAMRLLLDHISASAPQHNEVMLQPELVVRASASGR